MKIWVWLLKINIKDLLIRLYFLKMEWVKMIEQLKLEWENKNF